MIINRVWAMPNKDTFSVKPIGQFVKKYLKDSTVSFDSFARNKDWATHTNDISPDTSAQNHLEAEEFHKKLELEKILCDLWIFDAPYSPRQVKECYEKMGRKMQLQDGQTARLKKIWKASALPVISKNGIVLSFGWNTVGMGKKLGFEIVEILLVCHGGDHNDTICMAEKRL